MEFAFSMVGVGLAAAVFWCLRKVVTIVFKDEAGFLLRREKFGLS